MKKIAISIFATYFLVFNFSTAKSQGEYCLKLENPDDYFNSMEDVILCLSEVGNWNLALEKNEELREALNRIASNPQTWSVDEQHNNFMIQLQRISRLETTAKCHQQLNRFDKAREVMTSAIKEYNEIKFPFQQNKELFEKLNLIGEIGQSKNGTGEVASEALWHHQFANSDSMRRVVYEAAANKLNFELTWPEFNQLYPAVNVYGPMVFAESIALDIHKQFSTIYFAKLYMAECPDVDCYYEAIEFLEEIDLSEAPESSAVETYLVLGALHHMCQNLSLACRTIEKACNLDKEQSDSFWEVIQYMAENALGGNRICTCRDF